MTLSTLKKGQVSPIDIHGRHGPEDGWKRCGSCGNQAMSEHQVEQARVPAIIRKHKDTLFQYYKCPSCNSIQINATPDLTYYYEQYPLRNHKEDLALRLAHKERLHRLIEAGLSPKHAVLDYGCGVGLFVNYLLSHGFPNAIGFDPYIPHKADPALLDRQYDFVCCQDVIEHVPDVRALVKTLRSLALPGGFIEIGTPRADGISLAKEEDFRFEISAPYHLTILSEKALHKEISDQQLTIIKHYNTFYFDQPLPFFNFSFIKALFKSRGSTLDAILEPPRVSELLKRELLLKGLFGWREVVNTNMTVIVRREVQKLHCP